VIAMLRSLAALVSSLAAGEAWAQAPAAPLPTMPPSTAPAPQGSGGFVAAAIVIVALLVVIGVMVKLFDLKRKRSAEAVHLQAQISDALLREQNVFRLPITPTAHVPFIKGSPAIVEVSGEVPSSEMRDTVIRLVRNEATRIRSDVEVEDRLFVKAA
jgi:hypothetical protein